MTVSRSAAAAGLPALRHRNRGEHRATETEADLADPYLLAVMPSRFREWPEEPESVSRTQPAEALQPVRDTLPEGMSAGDLRRDLDLDRLSRVDFASHTLALRPGVHAGAPAEDRATRSMAQIGLLLEGPNRRSRV